MMAKKLIKWKKTRGKYKSHFESTSKVVRDNLTILVSTGNRGPRPALIRPNTNYPRVGMFEHINLLIMR